MNTAQSIRCEDCDELIDLDNYYMHRQLNLWKCAACGYENEAWEHQLTENELEAN